ncbi:MAG TPA: hypothetical protein VHB50_12595 [Bryobacteraceae bacterium]|nr:hypothetical protein [Bryobacteraceae bacterium]
MAARRTARFGRRSARAGVAACSVIAALASATLLCGGVVPSKDKLTEDEKIEILRNLSAEYAKAKTYFPRSKKPLEFDAADGSWDKAKWQMMAQQNGGPAAREGDQIKITHVTFDGDKLLIEINGGLKSGRHWYDHIETGMGPSTYPVSNGDYTPSLGTNIEINFHKPMENLTSDQIKKTLLPLMDFDKHSVTKVYAETLPPEMQKAIAEKRALEGMSRDEVLMALGHPIRKYRESKDGIDLEDWIYGEAPGKVTFVTFKGAKVVKVKEEYAGLGIQTTPAQVITP